MPYDPMTGEFFLGTLAAHREAVARVGGLFAAGYALKTGALDVWVEKVMIQLAIKEGTTGVTVASGGGLLATGAAGAAAAGAIPVVGMVGVWAALGSGYLEAREQAKSEHSASGFSHGFVAAVLGWAWRHAVSRFGRRYLRMNRFDGEHDQIRVLSYNGGLKSGFLAGSALPDEAKKAYRLWLRKLAGRTDAGPWSGDADAARREQVAYVTALAAAARKHGVIRPEAAARSAGR
jgi:hypothetical protein